MNDFNLTIFDGFRCYQPSLYIHPTDLVGIILLCAIACVICIQCPVRRQPSPDDAAMSVNEHHRFIETMSGVSVKA